MEEACETLKSQLPHNSERRYSGISYGGESDIANPSASKISMKKKQNGVMHPLSSKKGDYLGKVVFNHKDYFPQIGPIFEH